MADIDRERAMVFGEVAGLYDAARPGYPAELFDDVMGWVPLTVGDPVLESGAGTGKATREWVARGLAVTAVEPSDSMGAIGSAITPDATFVKSTFEDFSAEPGSFSLVTAAQAWHWVNPGVGYPKAARLLRPGGALATFWQLPWFPQGLPAEIAVAYRHHAPGLKKFEDPNERLAQGLAGIVASGVFAEPETRQYVWVARYATREWIDLMLTHSDHRILEPEVRELLLAEVAAAIDAAGGFIETHYVTNLMMARPVR